VLQFHFQSLAECIDRNERRLSSHFGLYQSGFFHEDAGFDYFYKHGFDGGHNGNVVKTCIAFWIRRTIDGTANEFYKGLLKLLKTYDPGLLKADVPAPGKQ